MWHGQLSEHDIPLLTDGGEFTNRFLWHQRSNLKAALNGEVLEGQR